MVLETLAGNGDDASELLEDFISQGEGEDEYTNLQQKSDFLLKPLDLAEEIEKKQANLRFEGVKRGSDVLGYFEVLPVHLSYFAGMSRGSILLCPASVLRIT
ncbi:hypothetical protein OROMI_017354 [Orobanche minor]